MIDIREEHKDICQRIVAVARQLGLTKFSGKFKPNDDWGADIQFSWEAGRHGYEGTIKISSEYYSWVEESETFYVPVPDGYRRLKPLEMLVPTDLLWSTDTHDFSPVGDNGNFVHNKADRALFAIRKAEEEDK